MESSQPPLVLAACYEEESIIITADKRKPLSVSFVLKETGLLAVENVGTVILTSLFWAICLIPGIVVLPIPVAGIYIAIVASIALTPVMRYVYLVMRHKRERKQMFPVNLFKRMVDGTLLGFILAFAFIVVYAVWWYYFQKSHIGYLSLALLQTYLLIMFCFASTYVLPIICREEITLLAALKKSVRIFLLKPGFTVVLWVQIITIGLVFIITTMAFALLYAGLLAFFLIVATEYALNMLTVQEQ